jgi:hypothetical protein
VTAAPSTVPDPSGAIAMDVPAHPKDYAPRGTDRVRSARHTRPAGPSRFWRSALALLAIVLAVLVVLATRSG